MPTYRNPFGESARVPFWGVQAHGTLRVAANVADTETVTVAGEVYQVNVVNTSMAKTSSCNNTDDPVTLTITAHGWTSPTNVGDLLRMDSEIMKILTVPSVDTVTAKRAHSATSKATHSSATVYKATNLGSSTNKEVGLVTTLTPTVFGDAFCAVFNSENALGMSAHKTADFDIVVRTTNPVTNTGALSEGLAGTNNVWLDSALQAGLAPTYKPFCFVQHTLTANDVTATRITVAVPFTPVVALIEQRTSAGLRVANLSTITLDTTNKAVKVAKGSETWTANDVITLSVWG